MHGTGERFMPDAEDAVSLLAARHPLGQIESGGRRLSFRTAGQGEPIILLHGIGSGSGSWLHQLDALAAHARVVAWDAPGYGATAPLADPVPTAADYGHALASFLDALRIDRAVLIGHSLGALMAGAFAVQQPQRLRGLLLLDPAGGHATVDPATRAEMRDARLRLMAELGPERMAAARAASLLSARASAQALALVQWNMAQLNPAGYAQATHMLAGGDLAADLARYRGPLRVLCGTEDRITPEAACRRLAAAAPRGSYGSLPGLGHACYIEAPGTVNAAILAFIADCARA